MTEKILDIIVCPRDKKLLEVNNGYLCCVNNHKYPIIDDIPVLLIEDVEPTHNTCLESLKNTEDKYGINDNEGSNIDPYVREWVAATCGIMYKDLVNNLQSYPIPQIPIEINGGKNFLDIGCGWGRWSVAAAQKGYNVIGVDPSIDAIRATRRLFKQFELNGIFLVGDARYLPFNSEYFDVVFSYSVLQHFKKENVIMSLKEISRILNQKGKSVIQMPNKYGLRNFYTQTKKGFRRNSIFDVSYWSPGDLLKTFQDNIGKSNLFIDGFFGLGVQKSDIDLFPLKYKLVVHFSELLKKINKQTGILTKIADSLFVESFKN